jgi:hypothetical protein
MSYYCDFDSAAAAIEGMLGELVREQFGDMPRGELDAIREFVFRDFMHYLATRAGYILLEEVFGEEGEAGPLRVYREDVGKAVGHGRRVVRPLEDEVEPAGEACVF